MSCCILVLLNLSELYSVHTCIHIPRLLTSPYLYVANVNSLGYLMLVGSLYGYTTYRIEYGVQSPVCTEGVWSI